MSNVERLGFLQERGAPSIVVAQPDNISHNRSYMKGEKK